MYYAAYGGPDEDHSFVFKAFRGDVDCGREIISILRTADQDWDVPDVRKDYERVHIFGNKLTSEDVSLIVTPSLDLGATNPLITDSENNIVTFNSLLMNAFDVPMPQIPNDLGYYGAYLGVELYATKRWNFKSLVQIIRMRE